MPSDSLRRPAAATASCTIFRSKAFIAPSAFLREFLAALTLHPRTNLAGLGLWAAFTAYLAYAVLPG